MKLELKTDLYEYNYEISTLKLFNFRQKLIKRIIEMHNKLFLLLLFCFISVNSDQYVGFFILIWHMLT